MKCLTVRKNRYDQKVPNCGQGDLLDYMYQEDRRRNIFSPELDTADNLAERI